MIFSLVNTLGGFILNRMITEEAAIRIAAGTAGGLDQRASIGTMAGTIQTWVNLLAFVLQAFVVSRLFKDIRSSAARCSSCRLSRCSVTGRSAVLPVFGVFRWAKVLKNGTDYSINNTTRHALFLPTSRAARYKAKQAIDSFFVRAGDLLQAVVVFVGVYLAFDVRSFAMVNLALVAVWLIVVVAIAREYKKRVPAEAVKDAA